MLVSNIIGGLGNQMFQYAAGRACSLKLDVPLKLDTRDFSEYQLHQGFELNRLFNCSAEIATDIDLAKTLGWQSAKWMRRVLKRPQLKALRSKGFVVEPSFNYWDGINQLEDNKYLYGHWQTEKYFSEFADNIRKDFTFKLSMSNQNAEIAHKISQVNAVSLHVRRGDYITNPKNTHYEVCSLEYYLAAVEQIKRYVEKPEFFVFSDDINWVKASLPIDAPTNYIDHNDGLESYNDMRLMSLCKHNITANSSFSWWGAWLNQNAEKIVIAPRKWFSNSTDTTDLIPASWIRL